MDGTPARQARESWSQRVSPPHVLLMVTLTMKADHRAYPLYACFTPTMYCKLPGQTSGTAKKPTCRRPRMCRLHRFKSYIRTAARTSPTSGLQRVQVPHQDCSCFMKRWSPVTVACSWLKSPGPLACSPSGPARPPLLSSKMVSSTSPTHAMRHSLEESLTQRGILRVVTVPLWT